VSHFIVTDRNGKEITDWRAWTRPKRDYQWRAGRSAMELARAWFAASTPTCPREIADLLASHPQTASLSLIHGIPEHVTALPERGEGRNHDLLLLADGRNGRTVISIEAKVDESFGETVGTYWAKAKRSTEPTRAPERIEALLSMAFGPSALPNSDPWQRFRYQLLTAVTGTAIEAAQRQAAAAIVIVHDFAPTALISTTWQSIPRTSSISSAPLPLYQPTRLSPVASSAPPNSLQAHISREQSICS
jgi:hypothetical protein